MATDDFFHARLDTMIDLRHPLAKLAQRMPLCKSCPGAPHRVLKPLAGLTGLLPSHPQRAGAFIKYSLDASAPIPARK